VVLLLDRLLDLEQQVGVGPDVVGLGDDLRPGGHVVGVRDRGALACGVLDQDRVPGADQLRHPGRGERDPVLTVLDLSGDPDAHDLRLLCLAGRTRG